MALHRSIVIALEALDICNPVSTETIDRAVRLTGLGAGARVIDLGCGNAAMAIHLAETFGFAIDAVEREPSVFAEAERRAAGRGAPGSVALIAADSSAYLAQAADCDLLVAAGADHLAHDPHPKALLEGLMKHVRPGGFILWCDPFWNRPPDAEYKAFVEASGLRYLTYAESIAAGEDLGLKCWYAAESSRRDWDDTAWRVATASQVWVEENPDHPDADNIRLTSEFIRGLYVNKARDCVGFGVFLFRRPPAPR